MSGHVVTSPLLPACETAAVLESRAALIASLIEQTLVMHWIRTGVGVPGIPDYAFAWGHGQTLGVAT